MSDYQANELIRIAKRDGNPKRAYLILNLLQAKHVPTRVNEFCKLSRALAESIHLQGESATVVAFAETATAIGATAALYLDPKAFFIHSTREKLSEKAQTIEFKEKHSHAVDHELCVDELMSRATNCSDLVFVDDEYSTGKTLLNAMNAVKPLFGNCEDVKLHAASILNRMDTQTLNYYKSKALEVCSVVQLEESDPTEAIIGLETKPIVKVACHNDYECIFVDRRMIIPNPRLGVVIGEYYRACENALSEILQKICEVMPLGSKIGVLGTEECMFPSLMLALGLENAGKEYDILCHSTTRSPICSSDALGYPICDRYELTSPYESSRKTFIYNVQSYDAVVVVSDAAVEKSNKGIAGLMSIFSSKGCNRMWWVAV